VPALRSACSLLPLLAILATLLSSLAGISQVSALEPNHEYYGYVPPRIWGLQRTSTSMWEFEVNPNSILDRGLLVFIGNYDQTKVSVYVLPNRSLVESFSVNKMEEVTVPLPNDTFFKAVSDKPVTLILMAGRNMESGHDWAQTFFTSVEGGYVGREFIFKAIQAATTPYAMGFALRVFALEDSDVIVVDVSGSTAAEFSLKANQYRQLSFTPLAVYALTSTGNVMIQSWTGGSIFFPAAEGGFSGKLFYGAGRVKELWTTGIMPPAYYLTGPEDAKARIIDLEFRKEFSTTNVVAGVNNSLKIDVSHIAVESEKPVTLMFANGGVAYAGVKPGETIELYVPTGKDALSMGEAYIYAEQGTTVTLDDVKIKVSTDEMLPLHPGMHRISADRNAVIQVVHWYMYVWAYTRAIDAPHNGIANFATCVPSVQAMSLTYGGIRLKPVLGGETPPWLYAIAAAAPLALVAIWATRRRKPSRR